MGASDENEPIRRVLWRLAPMIYGPTTLFGLGEGAVIPLIPVIAAQLGADVATSALVAAALVVGQLCGNLPAGWAVARIGERATMIIAGLLALVGVAAMAFAPVLGVFAASVFLIGICAAAFGVARHAFMTTRVPVTFRARALSLLGGSFRLGMFVGPFIAAALLWLFGDEHATIWFFGICLVAMIALVAFGPEPEKRLGAVPAVARTAEGEALTTAPVRTRRVPGTGVVRTAWRNRDVLARLGVAAASLSALRSTRQVLLPLWGVAIGLDGSTIALVVGVSGAIDFALFYASGQVMDRFGRLWAALPAMLLMSAGLIALALTSASAQPELWFALFAAVLGVGNGLSSGILLTLGADVAPTTNPAPFLGSWRTLTDAGGAIAPLLVSGITAVASLPVAAAVMGGFGLVGAFGFIRWVPRFVPRTRLDRTPGVTDEPDAPDAPDPSA
ncbi:MFS transporter [Microbacterium sp. AG238]|uniref:MFS transporter n=1 Tax=Microbacterium sp. AG238 TaxID=2183994 RepID=UPI000E7081E0|nr:MFS transporter [Microbacterium sp. AG238]RKE63295.1 putative MFS family arabinose efflux permease [Microbacterium sp. AG238]